MENGLITWKNSIFSRLFTAFILIIIPIYIIGISIYNMGISTLRKEILNSMTAQVSFYLGNLEKEIQGIKKAQYECLYDSDLNQLATIPEYLSNIEERKSILNLQHRLEIIKNGSVYIKNVGADIPSIGKTVYADGDIENIDQEKFNALKVFPNSPDSQIIYFNDRLFLSAVYPLSSIIKKNSPLYNIEIELSNDGIKKALEQFNSYNDCGAFLYNPSNDLIIVSHETNKENEGFVSQVVKFIHNTQNQTDLIKMKGKTYLTVHVYSEYLGMTLARYLPESEVLSPIRKYQVWFWIFTAIAVCILILLFITTYKMIRRPLLRLVRSLRKVEEGDLSIKIDVVHNDEFGYLYRRFNAMTDYLKTLIDQVYKQKIFMQKAELKQLQSQINPHFLYNSFFIMSSMLRMENYKGIEKFIVQLGEYYQFITRNASDEVPLCKEMNHARIYADIQALRFARRISVVFDEFHEEYANIMVPRLIIQPVIENSFEHGLEKKKNDGILHVGMEKIQNGICIFIEDNGESVNDKELEKLKNALSVEDDGFEVTGVINIHRRIRLKFGSESGITVSRGSMNGFKVEINIKLESEGLSCIDC